MDTQAQDITPTPQDGLDTQITPPSEDNPLQDTQEPTPPENNSEATPTPPSQDNDMDKGEDTTPQVPPSIDSDVGTPDTPTTLPILPEDSQGDTDSDVDSEADTPSTHPPIDESIEVTPPPTLPEVDNDIEVDINEKLEAFIKELEAALEKNESVVANTHFALKGIAELLSISKDIWEFYQYQVNNLKLNNEQVNILKESLNTISEYINQVLKEISQSHKTSLSIFKSTEALLDEAKNAISSIHSDLDLVRETLGKIGELELNLESIKKLVSEYHALLAQGQSLKDEINALVPNILNSVKAELLKDKENYERELEAKKDEFLELFIEKMEAFHQKIADFDADFATKQEYINTLIEQLKALDGKMKDLELRAQNALDIIEQETKAAKAAFKSANENLEKKTQACKDELDTAINTAKDSLTQTHIAATTAIGNARKKLEEQRDTHLNELSAAKDTHLSTLGEAVQTHSDTLTALQEEISDNFNEMATNMQEQLNAVGSAQIADLTQIVNEIKAKQTALGHNFQFQNFTANDTWTKPENAQYFYVFVQGGTGASLSNTSGGLSSFGSYLSAAGGSGSEQGAGQKGECIGAFLDIAEDSVSVVVGSGGIVSISWSERG